MHYYKRMLALCLTAVMLAASLPQTLYAAAADVPAEGVQEAASEGSGNDSFGEVMETADTAPVTDGQESEEEIIVEDISKEDVLLEGTVLTAGGDPVSANTAKDESYLFTPEETGIYYLTYLPKEDKSTYFYWYNQQNWQTYCIDLNTYNFMYLNQGETYAFKIRYGNDGDETTDYTLQMSGPVTIDRISVAKAPVYTSYQTLDFTGMQLRYELSDGTTLLEQPETYVSNDRSYMYLQAFRYFAMWSYPLTETEEKSGWGVPTYQYYTYANSWSSSLLIDDNYQAGVSSLEEGIHTAEFTFSMNECDSNYNMGETAWSDTVSFDFTIERDSIESIEVTGTEKTVYQEKMNETLQPITIKVNYKDGREERIISSNDNGEISQQFIVTGEDGQVSTTNNVDIYLQNGGSVGDTEAAVTYRGVSTAYPITIEETPYESLEVVPDRTVYYAGCSATNSDGVKVCWGDSYHSYYNHFVKYIFHRKDGTQEEYTHDMYLPGYGQNGRYVTAGFVQTADASDSYSYVDDYLAAGGTVGETMVRVSYGGFDAFYDAEIVQKEVDHIEVLQKPNQTKYIHNDNYGVNFAGMVIRAYKDAAETEWEDYDYTEYTQTIYNSETGAYSYLVGEEEGNYFRAAFDYRLDGSNSISTLELGTYPMHIYFNGKETSYDIEVVDSLISDFSVTKAENSTLSNIYLLSNVADAYISPSSLVYSFTDESGAHSFQGGTEAFNTYLTSIGCYSYPKITFPTDITEPGDYNVIVKWLGATAYYPIQVADNLIADMQVIKQPEAPYVFVGENVSDCNPLNGLELEVTELDGTVKKYRYGQYYSSGEYSSWSDLDNYSQYYSLDMSNIDSSTEGSYHAVLSYKGISVEIPVEVKPSPVEEIVLTAAPKKNTYYDYQTGDMYVYNVSLNGMEYEIRYNDGTESYSGKIDYNTNQTSISYQGKYYSLRAYSFKNIDTDNQYAVLGENAIILKYLGKTVEIPVTVVENPVKSIVCTKNPDKMEYIYMNYISESVNLSGAEFLVTYQDGTTENVVCSENGSPSLNKYEDISLSSYLNWGHVGYEKRGYLRVSCATAYVSIPVGEYDIREHVDAELNAESLNILNDTEGKRYQVLSFTPETTQTYHCSIAADNWMNLYLFDSSLQYIENESGNNTYVSYELEAGETYYYIIDTYQNSVSNIIVRLSATRTSAYLADEDVESIRVTKAPAAATHYEFETSVSVESYQLDGMELEITLTDGKVLTEAVTGTAWGSITVFGLPLQVKWKETEYDEDDECSYAARTDTNALIFTYAGKTAEVPAVFGEKSPVSSIDVTKNPWAEKKYYQYNVADVRNNRDGLELTIHYNDGRADDVLTWNDDNYYYSWNGYSIRIVAECTYDEDDVVNIGTQYVTISYMGATVKAAFTVRENPVRAISIAQTPEKMTYSLIGFSTADLYGLEATVFFTDGTQKTVKVTEHTNKALVKDEFYLIGSTYNSSTSGRNMRITCENKYVVRPMTAKPLSESVDEVLTAGQEVSVSLDDQVVGRIYSFTPEENGVYAFYSEGNYDTFGYLYDASGNEICENDDGGNSYNFRVEKELYAGKTYYYLAKMLSEREIGTFTCRLEKVASAVEKEEVTQLEIAVPVPQAGRRLADEEDIYEENSTTQYTISSVRWSPSDYSAGYGKVYRMTMKLMPRQKYEFTADTGVMINGAAVSGVGYNSDGGITVVYTFPRTICKVIFPEEVTGYTLDTGMNDDTTGITAYKGSYQFAYNKTEDTDSTETIVVKANGNKLTPDANGVYTVSNITSCVNITVKTSADTAGENESLIKMYDKTDLYDIMTAELGASLSDNEQENVLPTIESYQNDSDQFFFGWYTNKNADNNGTGTRFTSRTLAEQTAYDLYAKWGTGIFSHSHNGLYANYKILSIDESNRVKVQFGDGHNPAVSSVAATGLLKADGADAAIEIPHSLDLSENENLSELGIALGAAEVVSIGANAFSGNTDMVAVKIPDTVESIGADAFNGCTNLEEVALPASLESVESGTFQGCTSLASVTVPDGVTSIAAGAFDGCTSLTTVTLPDTIESIEEDAFKGASDFTIVCSSKAAENEAVVKLAQETNAAVEKIEIEFSGYPYADKTFKITDSGMQLVPLVKVNGEAADREIEISWTEGYEEYFTVEEGNGSYTITPKAATDGNYILTAEVSGVKKQLTFAVESNNLVSDMFEGERRYTVDDIPAGVYNGQQYRPEVVVRDRATGNVLVKDKDYELQYIENQVVIYGIGNYSGTLYKSFAMQKGSRTITAEDISTAVGKTGDKVNATIDGDAELMYYSSDSSVVEVDTKTGVLTPKQAGTATITIFAEETENYEFAIKTVTVTVAPAANPSGDNKVDVPNPPLNQDVVVTNTKKEKTITVKATSISKAIGSKKFSIGANVTGNEPMTYSSSKTKVATIDKNGKVTVKSIGKTVITIQSAETEAYQAAKTVKVTLLVTPKQTTLSSVKSSKSGKITVKWKKTDKASGYKILYATNKNFKNAKTVEVKSGKTTSKTISVKKGKKYYIKVCAYTKSGGSKICGEYSKSKNVKAKK